MNNIDFVELAICCQERYKMLHNSNEDYYLGTLFIAINEDKVLSSTTPHILNKAEECILIHERRTLAATNYYSWYKVETIDRNGCVSDGNLEEGFRLEISWVNRFANQTLFLKNNKDTLYSSNKEWAHAIVKVWKLYSKLKDVKTERERKLIAELFRKDETILDLENEIENFKYSSLLLEEERNQYKLLLEDIQKLVSNK